VEWDRPQMTIWRMRIACWITKATHTHTHSEYAIVFLFHCNNGCKNAIQCHVIRTVHVLFTAADRFIKTEDRNGRVHTVKTYGGVQFELHSFFTWALDGAEWLDLRIARFITHGRNK
jgi:hypothetical protein